MTQEEEKTKSTILSEAVVKEFLTQYFSKAKLGENNSRIKPYLTDSAYSEELSHQEESINQVYKDYLLNYCFETANIYVNTEENEVLAEVTLMLV